MVQVVLPSTPPPAAPGSFAQVADVVARGYAVADSDQAKVTELLADVSDAIRARGKRVGYDVDAAIASGAVSPRTATRVTVAAAQRVRDTPAGPQVEQEAFGPFQRRFNLDAMYLRKDELADLGIPSTAGARGTMGDDPTLPDIYTPVTVPYPPAGSCW